MNWNISRLYDVVREVIKYGKVAKENKLDANNNLKYIVFLREI